jgi:Tfp pilus assembly protein PilF
MSEEGGVMEERLRSVRRAGGVARGLARCLIGGLALGILATGCARTVVTLDEAPTVSEARAKRDLGVDYLGARRTAMAIRELSASLELDPSDPQTHLWLGEAYRRKGQTAQAERYLKDALELARTRKDVRAQHEALLTLSALLSQMGRYEDSLEHCAALAVDPTFSSPWRPLSNCGWALMQLGRLDEARERFQEALDYFPRFGPALLNLGILEAKQGHRLAAIRTFEQAIESQLGRSGRAEAHFRLGELYVALGRRDKAIEHFHAAAEKAPNLDWGSQSQAYLDLLR